MIPEWLSFRNEFCSRVKFVPHSHDKIERLRQRRSCSRGFCARSETQSIRKEVRSRFTWYQNEILYQNDGFIRIEFRMTCVGNEMWFRYHVNTNREIYRDKMNSFQTVCHSGLWIARLNELRNKGMSRAGFWATWKKQSNYSLLRNHSLSRHVMTHTKKGCVGAFITVLTKNWRYQMK